MKNNNIDKNANVGIGKSYFLAQSLDSRLLLDAAGAITAVEVAVEEMAIEQFQEQLAQVDDVKGSTILEDIKEAAINFEHGTNEDSVIFFVDSRINDIDALKEGVTDNVEFVIVNNASNGLDFINNYLEGRKDISSIHIVSHGGEGELLLGEGTLDFTDFDDEQLSLLSDIGVKLDQDADILIYGCKFGAGAKGAEAIKTLAKYTRADIAASDDLTGSSAKGGNWLLEKTTGIIEGNYIIPADIVNFSEVLVFSGSSTREKADNSRATSDYLYSLSNKDAVKGYDSSFMGSGGGYLPGEVAKNSAKGINQYYNRYDSFFSNGSSLPIARKFDIFDEAPLGKYFSLSSKGIVGDRGDYGRDVSFDSLGGIERLMGEIFVVPNDVRYNKTDERMLAESRALQDPKGVYSLVASYMKSSFAKLGLRDRPVDSAVGKSLGGVAGDPVSQSNPEAAVSGDNLKIILQSGNLPIVSPLNYYMAQHGFIPTVARDSAMTALVQDELAKSADNRALAEDRPQETNIDSLPDDVDSSSLSLNDSDLKYVPPLDLPVETTDQAPAQVDSQEQEQEEVLPAAPSDRENFLSELLDILRLQRESSEGNNQGTEIESFNIDDLDLPVIDPNASFQGSNQVRSEDYITDNLVKILDDILGK